MSQPAPRIRELEDQLHAYLEQSFPQYKIERDRAGELILWVERHELISIVERCRHDSRLQMNRLSDLTAYDNVDGKDGPERFVMVYQLYSMGQHTRLRLKLRVAEGQTVPTLSAIWRGANWLEREVFDMFGIRFENHPDLRRILMDERFEGFPLRKEYDLQDRQPFPDTLPVRIAGYDPQLADPEDQNP